MKGIILAGGNGTRLKPLTDTVNKHLLPINGKPMLQHCVEKMTVAGIWDILVVTGGNHLGGIAEFLGSGQKFNCHITYRVQEAAGGIAQALSLADGFVRKGENMCVLLGDNIFESSLAPLVGNFYKYGGKGAMVVLKAVSDPQRFGVAVIQRSDLVYGTEEKIVEIVEKPLIVKSNLAVTGIYFYDSKVFEVIQTCRPSKRHELEITDVNNFYVRSNTMRHIRMDGWWTDAGTHESYKRANDLMSGLIQEGD
jgi:glucose-1-phosphate thymidylyltransferase